MSREQQFMKAMHAVTLAGLEPHSFMFGVALAIQNPDYALALHRAMPSTPSGASEEKRVLDRFIEVIPRLTLVNDADR